MIRASDILKRIPQYTRTSRHLRSVLEHGTPRKWANLALAEAERKLRRTTVRSRPYLLIIDPCNYCNLRCPLCPTGLGDLGRTQAMMSLEHFQRYFDPHAPYLFEVYLHNWGESLLNKQVFKMIAHARAANVGTNMSSNFVAVDSSDIDNLLESGLEYLVVSLDGTTPEAYSQYRVRGDFDRVVENMSELLRRRKARGLHGPTVEWQFILMKHNEHQMADAQAMARKIGVDVMRFIPVGVPHELRGRADVAAKWRPASAQGEAPRQKPGPCFYMYRSMVVNPDGHVSPCCEVYRTKHDFADLSAGEIDIAKIWNNEHYRSGRSLFSAKSVDGRVPTVCDGCDIFAWHPSKRRERDSGLVTIGTNEARRDPSRAS